MDGSTVNVSRIWIHIKSCVIRPPWFNRLTLKINTLYLSFFTSLTFRTQCAVRPSWHINCIISGVSHTDDSGLETNVFIGPIGSILCSTCFGSDNFKHLHILFTTALKTEVFNSWSEKHDNYQETSASQQQHRLCCVDIPCLSLAFSGDFTLVYICTSCCFKETQSKSNAANNLFLTGIPLLEPFYKSSYLQLRLKSFQRKVPGLNLDYPSESLWEDTTENVSHFLIFLIYYDENINNQTKIAIKLI